MTWRRVAWVLVGANLFFLGMNVQVEDWSSAAASALSGIIFAVLATASNQDTKASS